MYTVLCDGAYLYSPEFKEYKLIDPTVTLEANKAGRFEFTILANHPMYSAITRLKSLIEVYDDGVLLFRGRPLNDSIDLYNSQTVLCVGELDYLNDSIMPPYNFTGGISTYLSNFINNHNTQVEPYKQFQLGLVTVTDPNNTIVRSNQDYSNTWEEINEKLINNLGGYLVLRRENDINYIDYLEDALYSSTQEIRLTENMLDYQQEINANDITTIMIPLGAKIKDEQGNDTDRRVTIESVNGGKSFVEDTNGIAKWGRIWSVQIWDDVTDPNNLKSKAISSLNTLVNLGVSITIKAVDLSLVDNTMNRFRQFEYVRVVSAPHQIDEMMLIKKQTIKLDDPSQNTIELGVEFSSFTDKQLQANNIIKKVYSNYVTNEVVAEIREITTILESSITQLPDEIRLWVSEQTYGKTLIDEKFNEIYVGLEGIRLEVSQLGGYNIISNAIGTYGTMDWTFRSEPFHAKSTAPYAVINAEPIFAINTNGPIMRSVESNSAAKTGFRFWHEGLAFSKYAIVESGSEYSLHTKVKGSGILRFKLREYTSPTPTNIDAYHKETLLATSIVNNSYTTFENTLRLETNTICVVLVVESDVDIYTQQYAEFTDTSFNIGAPKPYGQSLTDVNNRVDSLNARVEIAEDTVDIFTSRVQTLDGRVDSATAQLTVQAGEISSKVSQNGVISAINQSPETITIDVNKLNVNGFVTLTDLANTGRTTINGANITTGKISGERLDITGKVTATSGKIAGFDISGNNLVGNDVSLMPNEITLGSSSINKSTQTDRINIKGMGIAIGEGYTTSQLRYIQWNQNGSFSSFATRMSNGATAINATSIQLSSGISGDIGSSDGRYANIYLQNQPNVASDSRYKFNIEDIDPNLLELVSEIKPKSYKTKFDDKVHFGYIAQDVERALYKYCLQKHGYEVANEWLKQFAVLSKDESYLSLLYGEIQVLTDAYTRMRLNKLEMAVQQLLERK